MASKDIIALFDIDGTLTAPRKKILPNMKQVLMDLRQKITIGIVGGSDFKKQQEQLDTDILDFVDFSFPENGLIAYHNKKFIHFRSIKDYLNENKIKKFINFCLHYIADLDLPIKRGTFIEFRT